MSKWLSERYHYNLGKYVGLSQVGETIPLRSQEISRSKLDKVEKSYNGIITHVQWYMIADDAVLGNIDNNYIFDEVT